MFALAGRNGLDAIGDPVVTVFGTEVAGLRRAAPDRLLISMLNAGRIRMPRINQLVKHLSAGLPPRKLEKR